MRRVCEHLCPRFQLAMDIIARPWNGLIMASLEDGPLRFGELHAKILHVGGRLLSGRLKDLQARGLIERRVIPGPPVGVEYELIGRRSRVSGRVRGGRSLWSEPERRAAAAACEAGEAHREAASPRPLRRQLRPADRPAATGETAGSAAACAP